MGDTTLRIRAIADMQQAKAQLASLTGEQLKAQTASLAKSAEEAKAAAALQKLQIETARAAGKSRTELKAMTEELKRFQAEAKIAAAEAKFVGGFSASSQREQTKAMAEERRRARAEARTAAAEAKSAARSAAADAQAIIQTQNGPSGGSTEAEKAATRSRNKGFKFVAQRLGVPEAAIDNGVVSTDVLKGAGAAAITAAIVLGFRQIAAEQRAAQAAIGSKATNLAEAQDELVRKGAAAGLNSGQLAGLLGKASGTRGVASTEELVKAAIRGLDESGLAGAQKAISDTAAGPDAITAEQIANRTVRRRRRDFELQASLANAEAIAASGDEDLAKDTREQLAAAGGQTVLGRGLAYGAEKLGLGQRAQLNALNAGNTATLLGRNGEGSRYAPIRVEVANSPRPLNGD